MLVLLVSIVVYAISFLLTMALSRYRELAADRSGAILIGRPSVLASALVKITGDMSRIPQRDLRKAEAFNAFFFTPAVSGAQGASLATLFSTHPSLEQRLAQRSQSCANLKNRFPRTHRGEAHDLFERVFVDDKVLTKFTFGLQRCVVEQRQGLRLGQAHQETEIFSTPADVPFGEI